MIALRFPGRKALRYLLYFAIGPLVLGASVTVFQYSSPRNDVSAGLRAGEALDLRPYKRNGSLSSPGFFTLNSSFKPVADDKPCAPLGDPLDGSRYKGHNAFYLCKEGERLNTASWGNNNVELFIACKPSTRRSGVKWHIWCNEDGSHCGCNRSDFIRGDSTCCQFSAGDHCTASSDAVPGRNGCATW